MRKKYSSLGRQIPKALSKYLFGDRDKFGLVPDYTDKDWLEWQDNFSDLYFRMLRKGMGALVIDRGYKVMPELP